MSSRGVAKSDVQRTLRKAHQRLLATTRTLSGADSVMLKAAGDVLKKHIQRQLSTKPSHLRMSLTPDASGRRRVYGDPSAPGEAPRQLTGATRRGIRNRVLEGERQVRAENFKSKILELGFVAPAQPSRTIARGKRKGQQTAPRSARSMAPRPFMRPGLESAKPELAKVGGTVLRDGVRAALAQRAGGLGGD